MSHLPFLIKREHIGEGLGCVMCGRYFELDETCRRAKVGALTITVCSRCDDTDENLEAKVTAMLRDAKTKLDRFKQKES